MLKHLGKTLNTDDSKNNYLSEDRMNKGIYQKDSFDFLFLVKNWSKIVGEKLAKNTAPVKIYNSQLIILTSHSVFNTEINFLNEIIIKKIVQDFPSLAGKIKKIGFQTSNNFFKDKKEELDNFILKDIQKQRSKTHQYSPEFIKLNKEADEKFADIEDQELKKLIKKLYVQNSQN